MLSSSRESRRVELDAFRSHRQVCREMCVLLHEAAAETTQTNFPLSLPPWRWKQIVQGVITQKITIWNYFFFLCSFHFTCPFFIFVFFFPFPPFYSHRSFFLQFPIRSFFFSFSFLPSTFHSVCLSFIRPPLFLSCFISFLLLILIFPHFVSFLNSFVPFTSQVSSFPLSSMSVLPLCFLLYFFLQTFHSRSFHLSIPPFL